MRCGWAAIVRGADPNCLQLYRLVEQPLASSLSTLFSRNLYTLAVSLAQSRNLPPSEVAEIYRRFV